MNITYIIGNGFDVNIGLKSRYADFYRNYVKQHTDDESDAVKRFKSGINDYITQETQKTDIDSIDWRDLEIALGQFTDSITEKEGEPLYLDINDSLKHYLIEEYKYFDADAFNKVDFFKHLTDPISNHFNRDTINTLRNFLGSLGGNDYINVISFNYTNSIEDLAGFKGTPIPVGNFISGRPAHLNNIFHIHLTLEDDEILVGLNDESQIANKKFHENRFLCNLYIKPRTNALLGTGVNQDCERIIANTDLFVLFGTSVGITDQKWWKAICERLLASNARLIYFVHSIKKRPHQNLYLEEMRDDAIRKLLTNAGKDIDAVFAKMISRCFVSFSDTMFKLPVNYGDRIKAEKTYRIGNSAVSMKVLEMGMKYVAVSVEAPNEESGVPAEGMWLKEFFPGYTHNSQLLLQSGDKGQEIPFDLIPISNITRRKDIFFEISSFYGKGNSFPLKLVPVQKKMDALSNLLKKR